MPRLGNLRKVSLNEILGIELGKRTTALRRVQTAKAVNESECFSLLTKTGTLDLECKELVVAGSKSSAREVRAAFITSLALTMESKGLRLNGLQQHFVASPSSLQSKLQNLNDGTAMASPTMGQLLDEQSLYSGLMSDTKTISTISF
ncbi:hypothetical protein ACHAXR_010232 [Thalassiosira sp. AJA248-18]